MDRHKHRYQERSYWVYLHKNQSFREILATLMNIPSPKSQLFNLLLSHLDLKPSYLRMVLCPTPSGKDLGMECKRKISNMLQLPLDILFPTERGAFGSLIHIYSHLQPTPLEYLEFLKDIRWETGADRRVVTRWALGKHKPSKSRQRILAGMLNTSPSTLFP